MVESCRRLLATATPFAPVGVEEVRGGDRHPRSASAPIDERSRVGRAAGVNGVLVADRALLRTSTGRIVELDETLTAWFLLLDGSGTVGQSVAEVAGEAALDSDAVAPNALAAAQHLAELGVVA